MSVPNKILQLNEHQQRQNYFIQTERMSENYIYLKKINTTTPIWLQVYTSIFRNYLFKYTGLRGVEGGVAHHPCNLQRYKKKGSDKSGSNLFASFQNLAGCFIKQLIIKEVLCHIADILIQKTETRRALLPLRSKRTLNNFFQKIKHFLIYY